MRKKGVSAAVSENRSLKYFDFCAQSALINFLKFFFISDIRHQSRIRYLCSYLCAYSLCLK